MSPKRKKGERVQIPLAKALAAGTLAVGLVWIILLIGLSVLIVKSTEPEKLILPCVFLLAACAAVCSGAVCARLAGAGILMPGLAAGVLLLAVVWVLSLAFAYGTSGEVSLPLKLLLCGEFPLFSLVGARFTAARGAKPRSFRKAVR